MLYIYIYIYRHTYIKFLLYLNENNTIFLKNLKDSKNINFLIKIIYNIFCIIKKYIKFEIFFSFSFNKTFSNPIVSTLQ